MRVRNVEQIQNALARNIMLFASATLDILRLKKMAPRVVTYHLYLVRTTPTVQMIHVAMEVCVVRRAIRTLNVVWMNNVCLAIVQMLAWILAFVG